MREHYNVMDICILLFVSPSICDVKVSCNTLKKDPNSACKNIVSSIASLRGKASKFI